MFPGFTSKVSERNVALASVVKQTADVLRVTDTTGTTVLTTITPGFGGFSGFMVVVNISGAAITTVTTGNIAAAVTIPQNLSCLFIFSKLGGVWYPGAIS